MNLKIFIIEKSVIGDPKYHNRERRISLTDTEGVGEVGDILKRLNISQIERDLNQKVEIYNYQYHDYYIYMLKYSKANEKFLAFRVNEIQNQTASKRKPFIFFLL